MSKLIDQSNDQSFRKLAGILRNYGDISEFIKTASIGDAFDSLPDTAFADQNGRQFPIHSAADATLSYLYASESNVPVTIKTAVQEALDAYGVTVPVVKTASAVEDKFYLIPEEKRWAVSNKETVKLAAEAIERESNMPVIERVQAAVRLMTKAAELNVSVGVTVEKLAGCVKSDLNITREWLEARSIACDKPQFAQAYRDMADKLASVKVTESNDRQSLIKLATVIADLDEKANLIAYYGRIIPDAVQSVFNTTKLAQQEVSINGNPIAMSRLLGSPADLYGDIFGEDFENSISNNGDIDPDALARELPQMPRDLSRVFLNEIGYRK
jgi:hypothetical protein